MPQAEVSASIGLSKTKLYELIKFPAPVSLSAQCVRWRSDEVASWMDRASENRDSGKEDRSVKARTAAIKSIKKRRASLAELASQG
jgi:predicted DNA-binding transcriptional regulator AlpA